MKLMICLVILNICNVAYCNDEKYKCPQKELDKLDSLFARVMSVSKYQRKVPENSRQLAKYCNETKSDFKIMEGQVKQCLSGAVKHLGSIFMYSVKNALKQNCQSKNRKIAESRFPMSKCLNLITRQTDVCMENLIAAVQRGKRAQEQHKIGYVCCGYYDYQQCVEGFARPRCNELIVTSITEYFGNVFQGVTDSICGDFTPDSDRCNSLPPLPKKTPADDKVKSLFYPVIELWESL